MTEKLNAGRRTSRRNWARLAFGYILLTGLMTFLTVIGSPARKEVAESLAMIWPMLGASWSVCTVIVCAYLGVSHLDNRLRKIGDG